MTKGGEAPPGSSTRRPAAMSCRAEQLQLRDVLQAGCALKASDVAAAACRSGETHMRVVITIMMLL